MSRSTVDGCRLDAVLWDMDGLLIDSEPLWFDVEREVMRRLGGRWEPEQQAALVGGPLDGTVGQMLAVAGPVADPAEVRRWLVDGMALRLAAGVDTLPGALDLLDALARSGVPCALVSSSHRRVMERVLERVGRARFAATVAGDEVTARKPHPEGYLRAAALLGAEPSRCVVLEDSDTGARAGVAAGCVTVVVPSVGVVPPAPGRVLRDSLVGLTVDWLCGLLPPQGPSGAGDDVPPAARGA